MLKLIKTVKISALVLAIASYVAFALCLYFALFEFVTACWYGALAFAVLCVAMFLTCNKFANYELDLEEEEEEEGEDFALDTLAQGKEFDGLDVYYFDYSNTTIEELETFATLSNIQAIEWGTDCVAIGVVG